MRLFLFYNVARFTTSHPQPLLIVCGKEFLLLRYMMATRSLYILSE